MQKKGNSLLKTKRMNRALIRNEIFYMKNPTRAEIAADLGLTKPTITTSVNDMIRDGSVEEFPMSDEDYAGYVGRRPMVLRIRPEYAYAVGIEIGAHSSEAVLTDLQGNIITSKSGRAASLHYKEMLRDAGRLIKRVLPEEGKILGVGVGLPGFVDSSSGIVRESPYNGWNGRHIALDLGESVGLPAIVDNNVRLRATGYNMEDRDLAIDSFGYFFISRGLACPLVIRHEMVTGHSFGAGEAGHMVLQSDDGAFTEADDLASETALMRRAQEKLLTGDFPALRQILDRKGHFTVKDILHLEKKGDFVAREIVFETIRYAGAALANVVNLLNPGLVVVDAAMMHLPENRDLLESTARSHFYGLNESEVKIRFLETNSDFGALGAARSVIQKMFLDE